MKRTLTILMVAAFTVIFVMTAVSFAGEYSEMEKMTEHSTKASKMIGSTVENRQGEKLGEISDLAIDPQNGRVTFAVLSSGGIMGMGDKLIPVPINAITFSAGKAVLDISKDRLASAPTFEKGKWDDMATRRHMENTYRFFGVSPYWQEKGTMEQRMQEKGMEKKRDMMEETREPRESWGR